AYALILNELDGPRKLPIVIGAFEAQSIAIALEKDNDIRTLWSMGASNGQLRRLFFTNGMYIVGAGWALGMVIALILIFLQLQFKLISWGPEVDQFYPVTLKLSHVLLTTVIVLGIGTIMSAWSTRNVVRN
ncbi:MAG: FtsX-like permease family protein, partial [Flavobacteriia bacterium]|nr:FtsX-like permease family protein [Flavobacteriia bacterium]